MASLNKVMLIGRLGKDPDVRYTQSNTAVANMSLATSERFKDRSGEWKEKTEWHKVVAWGRTAEVCQEYLSKGSQIFIEGSLQTNKWEDKDGNTRYTTEVKTFRMQMLDSKGENSGQSGGGQPVSSNVNLDDEDIDDDLPF